MKPTEILKPGTKVSCGNCVGVILSHSQERDQFNQPIIVHTVEFHKRYSHKGRNGKIYKPYNKVQRVNYASINKLITK